MPDDNNDAAKVTMAPTAKREVARRNAMNHFAATERRDNEVRKEMERQQTATTNQIAKLRALRLAKEEADRLAAASAPPAPHKTRKSRAV